MGFEQPSSLGIWEKQKPTLGQKWVKVLITHKDVRTRNYQDNQASGCSFFGLVVGAGMERNWQGKVLWQMIRSQFVGEGLPRTCRPRKDHNALNWLAGWMAG